MRSVAGLVPKSYRFNSIATVYETLGMGSRVVAIEDQQLPDLRPSLKPDVGQRTTLDHRDASPVSKSSMTM